jgi:hypothetical protein
MPIRFLKYNTLLIEHYLKDNGPKAPLPFILNLCLEHGKLNKPYPYPNNLYDYFPNNHVAQKLGSLYETFSKINLSVCFLKG